MTVNPVYGWTLTLTVDGINGTLTIVKNSEGEITSISLVVDGRAVPLFDPNDISKLRELRSTYNLLGRQTQDFDCNDLSGVLMTRNAKTLESTREAVKSHMIGMIQSALNRITPFADALAEVAAFVTDHLEREEGFAEILTKMLQRMSNPNRGGIPS